MKTLKPLQQLMQKKMSRKDFLKYLLAIAVAMIGIKTFMQLLVNPDKKQPSTKVSAAKTDSSYGGPTPYGL